jgi:hypothetical protein
LIIPAPFSLAPALLNERPELLNRNGRYFCPEPDFHTPDACPSILPRHGKTLQVAFFPDAAIEINQRTYLSSRAEESRIFDGPFLLESARPGNLYPKALLLNALQEPVGLVNSHFLKIFYTSTTVYDNHSW